MFAFTKQEAQVLLFVLAVSLAGSGAVFLSRTNSKVRAITVNWQDIGKVEVNSANQESLMSVPGIGKKIAQRVIERRKEKEGFKELADLKNIKGISEAKYEKIKGYLYVR
jgi:competence ComEA-like helix-hairpin-helix protein